MFWFKGKMKDLTYLELWLIVKFGRLLELLEPLEAADFSKN